MDAEALSIHLADVKAATISRSLRTSGYRSHKTFRIWKDGVKSKEVLEAEKEQIAQSPRILNELSTSFRLADFYARHEEEFRIRSEDAGRSPFTSLQTHNELTGAWFTLLINHLDHFGIPDEIRDARTLRTIKYKFSKREVAVLRVSLKVNTKLSRLRDAKLIKDVTGILDQICEALRGIIVYSLPEEILVILTPDSARTTEQTIKDVLGNRTNYHVEATAVNTPLSNKLFLHNYNRIFGEYEDGIYPVLDDEIGIEEGNEASHRAIICDMCQMAPARWVYPQDAYGGAAEGFDPVQEYLCDGCFQVRMSADRATNLAEWESEEGARIAFFKVSLSVPDLVATLRGMFADTFTFGRLGDEDIGFSIIKEFLHDYRDFLRRFRETALAHEDYTYPHNLDTLLRWTNFLS